MTCVGFLYFGVCMFVLFAVSIVFGLRCVDFDWICFVLIGSLLTYLACFVCFLFVCFSVTIALVLCLSVSYFII